MNKLFYTWKNLAKDAEILAQQIKAEYKPQSIIVITKGGLCVAGLLSQYLEVNNIDTACLYSYKGDKQGRIQTIKNPNPNLNSPLIVDDVVDTGETLKYVKRILPFAKSATLHYKPNSSTIKPDFYVANTDKWIVYPWEVNENDK